MSDTDKTAEAIIKLRKAGAVYVEVSPDAAFVVEFEGVPAKRRRVKKLPELEVDPRQIDMFSEDRVKELSDEQRETLLESLQRAYLP